MAHLSDDFVTKADFAVGTGSDSQIVPVLPVIHVVEA